jgi:transposase InsO family protein
MQAVVVAARKQHPKWGPRKLHAWLTERYPDVEFPSPSCIGDILKRHGLTHSRKRKRRRACPSSQPFAECKAPNDTWCIDFKGKFRTRDGRWCHVLTLIDAHSRFLLRCEAVADPNGKEVERILDSAFSEFGLPVAIRSDNGPPFASTGAGGLTRLAVWLLRLGIRLERIEPGKPYQNGRQERVHLTLEEVVDPPRANLVAQQRALDLWRKEYNQERPHEALGQKPPERAYEPSRRRYPRPLKSPATDFAFESCWVTKQGCIGWRGKKIFISTALFRETVEITPAEEEPMWEVSYGPILLGYLNDRHLARGLIPPRRKRKKKGNSRVTKLTLDEEDTTKKR